MSSMAVLSPCRTALLPADPPPPCRPPPPDPRNHHGADERPHAPPEHPEPLTRPRPLPGKGRWSGKSAAVPRTVTCCTGVMADPLPVVVERGDLDELVRLVDTLCGSREWDRVM